MHRTFHADPWRPILAGDLAAKCGEVLVDIADNLGRFIDNPYPGQFGFDPDPLQRQILAASLSRGDAALALLFSYLQEWRPGHGYDQLANRFMTRAGKALADLPLPPYLFSGFCGIAWTATHLHRRQGFPADDDPAEPLDEIVHQMVESTPWTQDYDLVAGLVGFGVYAAERLPGSHAEACLENIVHRLAELAEHRPEGVTWLTPPHMLPPQHSQHHPAGYYNLGVAHGIPGVIVILATASAAGIARDVATSLLEGAVDWMLAQQQPAAAGTRFPAWVYPGTPPGESRLAWCYGDPGVAGALLCAARCCGRDDWRDTAIAIGLDAAEVSLEASGVVDPPLCHGAAGLGHIFNRIHQVTSDERLAAASRRWFEQVLVLRRSDNDVAGFFCWEGEREIPSPGFLTGTAGIGLALLSAVAPIFPAWDRLLLQSAAVAD